MSQVKATNVTCIATADSFFNGTAELIQNLEFSAKLSVRPLHPVESVRAGEGTLWLEVHVTSTEHAYS